MRVLYIDFVSHRSHENFNFLQLSELVKLADVDLVVKSGYTKYPDLELNDIINIPSSFYRKNLDGLRTRLQYYRILIFLKKNIDFTVYDKIIYSYYEEISFFFARMPKGAYLFNHVNISGLSSMIKRWFYKRISETNIQLVFNETMRNHLQSIGIPSVKIVAHGLMPKYEIDIDNKTLEFLGVDVKSFAKVLFAPSASSADYTFIKELLVSKSFNEYLENKNYLLVVKGKYVDRTGGNILQIDRFLHKNEYQSLLIYSSIIILAYHKEFKYRVSAILFECISNNKNIVLSEAAGLIAYKDCFLAYPYFNDIASLIEALSYYDNHDSIYNDKINKLLLTPNYNEILNDL